MELRQVPQDDILDVLEMVDKVERSLSGIFRGSDRSLATSALISASVNCMLSQCDTLEEVILCRNILVETLDGSIRSIQITEP